MNEFNYSPSIKYGSARCKRTRFDIVYQRICKRKTEGIEREVDAALHQEIKRGKAVLFPIRLDNAILESHAGWATRLLHRHIGDWTFWQDDAAYSAHFCNISK